MLLAGTAIIIPSSGLCGRKRWNRFTNKLHCLLVFEPRVPPKMISPRTSTTVARSKIDQVQGLPVTVCPNWLDRPASFMSSVFSESSGPIRRKTGVDITNLPIETFELYKNYSKVENVLGGHSRAPWQGLGL